MSAPSQHRPNARTLFFNGVHHFAVASGMLRFLGVVAKRNRQHEGALVPIVFAVLGCEGFINELV